MVILLKTQHPKKRDGNKKKKIKNKNQINNTKQKQHRNIDYVI